MGPQFRLSVYKPQLLTGHIYQKTKSLERCLPTERYPLRGHTLCELLGEKKFDGY